jgi:dTDP-4-dehydrorhamnose reductase
LHWLVLGAGGQLGHALGQALSDETVALCGRELDVTDPDALAKAIAGATGVPPDVVVNAAAFTHVDRCEREPEEAMRVNALAPGLVATACARAGARLVHVSTDYVFDGEGDRPYREDDATGPRSVYGRTKLAGEEAVRAVAPDSLILRTSWVYGRGRNFVASILAQAQRGGPLRVVEDQRGCPTSARSLAEGLRALVERGASGLYHLAGAGESTWWELARVALDLTGRREVPVARIRTEELELDAPRPRYSVLDCGKAAAAGVRLPDWREALHLHLRSDDVPPEAREAAAHRSS